MRLAQVGVMVCQKFWDTTTPRRPLAPHPSPLVPRHLRGLHHYVVTTTWSSNNVKPRLDALVGRLMRCNAEL